MMLQTAMKRKLKIGGSKHRTLSDIRIIRNPCKKACRTPRDIKSAPKEKPSEEASANATYPPHRANNCKTQCTGIFTFGIHAFQEDVLAVILEIKLCKSEQGNPEK